VPKIVDHEARRAEIAEALWRVVRRDGIGGASVRTVAAEAGWSPGAVRYYFPDQEGLLNFAMDLVSRRVRERIGTIQATGTLTEIALRYLEEVIPLDAEREAEFETWLSFIAQALTETGADGLRDHLGPVQDGLLELCQSLITALSDGDTLRKGLDLQLEAERLHALLDGLALHVAVQPGRTTPARVHEILIAHLETLQP
jgi:AcrR family transcriptional regulator